MTEQVINTQKDFDDYIQNLKSQWEEHHYLRVTMKTGKQRSLTQNACLHLYCTQLAEALNDAGYDFRTTIKEGVDVPWTMDLVKLYMWKPIQEALTGHESTTKPERAQYSEIYDILNRHTGQKLGISVQWPSKDTLRDRIDR